ncbi:MAG TPA: hypothetical protein VE650_15935 [Acetobacteraceae bacterium]|nr:hypothetical protein [Acetobacteraceae bacterium]
MNTRPLATAAIAAVLMSGAGAGSVFGQTPPTPQAAAVVVASDAQAVVESVDKQARHVLLHLPDNTLVTLKVPPEVKTIDQLKPGDHVAVRYLDAAVVHLNKTSAAATEQPALGTAGSGDIQGVRTVVGVNPSRGTLTLADAGNHVETVSTNDRSMLSSVRPGDRVDITYKEGVVISLTPV